VIVSRDRGDYSTAMLSGTGSSVEVDVEDVARVVVTMPESYARDLLAEISGEAQQAGEDDAIEIKVDLPVRLTLSHDQLKKLVDQIDYKLRRMRLQEVP